MTRIKIGEVLRAIISFITKYIAPIAIIYLLLFIRAHAEVDFGINTGLSVTKVYSSDIDDSDYITRLSFGGHIFYRINSNLILQPEIMLISKGGKYDYSDYGIIAIEEDVFTYIELPVLLRYIVYQGNPFNFYFNFGPSFGFLIDARYKLTGLDAEYLAGLLNIDTEGSLKDLGANINSIDFSFQFGIGFGYKLNNGELSINLRYIIGFSNIIKYSNDTENKNRGFIAAIEYTFFSQRNNNGRVNNVYNQKRVDSSTRYEI